ncbi:rhomboid family intramembrane serine protease [Verrucomicrobiaceae bacterium N1E253]|uniref:Rhomboid family intramembrane serine protease n=1 Tax=Oceaniferula marina TaxID=2748318 RepID=A0A851GBM7_9BACT|nr:rhomboid family intramembrane serine protease [Oceaniferula marina]NWK54826.1 rhomboid family intramembrane serine protease [Oceaniferula marina]
MGIADRYYHQAPPNMPRQPSRLDGAPVIKWLLISNIAIFFLDILFFGKWLTVYGHFSVATVFWEGQVWRFLSFQFLHGHLGHLAFNMFALYMFGSFVERWWGSRKFIVFYLLSGCAGALLYSVLYQMGLFGKSPIDLGNGFEMPAEFIPLVGASAGIYACLVGVAVIAPNLQVRLLFPPIAMKMKTLAMVALAIAMFMTLTNGHNAGGEAGHLGGAVLGYLLMRYPACLSWIDRFGRPATGGRRQGRVVDAQEVRRKKIRPRVKINLDDSEVDRILDKVNREGLQSLTEKERETLRRAAGE